MSNSSDYSYIFPVCAIISALVLSSVAIFWSPKDGKPYTSSTKNCYEGQEIVVLWADGTTGMFVHLDDDGKPVKCIEENK